MTTAVLDTNVVVQSLIGLPRSASARVLDEFYDGGFHLAYTSETIDELIEVLVLPRMQDMHGLSDDEVLEFVTSLLVRATFYASSSASVQGDIARDITDTKFLALANESKADYLVTNDRRHLLRLRRFGQTRIVTPAEFLRNLP